MKEIKIKLDYSHGPIWQDKYDASTGEWSTGVDIIDADAALWILNEKAKDMYTSLYEFHQQGCSFDEDRFNSVKASLLSIIQTIILRLEQINDGSFLITDEETRNLLSE